MAEQQQFLYRIQPTRLAMLSDGPTKEEEEIVGDHFAYLQKLTEKGTVLLAGRTLNVDEDTFGLVIFQAESEQDAQVIMDNDPAVVKGVMSAKLFPYRIALMGEAFAQR